MIKRMKPLDHTSIYRQMNKSSAITKDISHLLKDSDHVTKDNIAEALMIIDKNFKFAYKLQVLNEIDNRLILRFSNVNNRLPKCLPYVLINDVGEVKAVIQLNTFGTRNEENGDIKIDPKKLYCLLESALMSVKVFNNWGRVQNDISICVAGSAIYSLMFTRVLNKKYSLNIDKSKYNKVMMLASNFYQVNMLGKQDMEMVFNYSVKNCPHGNLISLQETNDMFDSKGYNDLESFINELSSVKLGLGLKGLTFRSYMEAFINMYDASNLLSLESFPYFIYNVNSVVMGAYVNNQYVLEDIVGNYGAKLIGTVQHITNSN
jgi:hypothetical protein